MLSRPAAIAAIHLALLGLGSLFLYRALRRVWPGPAAAAAAAFPLLADSTRTVITWPTHSVDVGPYLFSAIAIHEAVRRRLATSLAALLGALLCKEVSVVTAALVPFVPRAERTERASRLRWAAAVAALVLAWSVTYFAIRTHAGLALPHGLESNPALLATPIPVRLLWALWNSLRAVFSLALVPGPWDAAVGIAVVFPIAAAVAILVVRPAARARLRATRGWPLWGAAWFLASCATLAAIFPLWAPARTLFGSPGLGIALVGALGAAHPALPPLLVAAKLGAFALSPAPPRDITAFPESRGAFTDFVKVARLQRLMRQTREALKERFPRLPPGARVAQVNLPRASEYALGGSNALQVWYRDSTLRWVRFEEFKDRPETELAAVVQFQESGPRAIVLVEAEALRGMVRSFERLGRGDFRGALREAGRADSIQTNRGAHTLLGALAGVRALALTSLGDAAAGQLEARRALELWPSCPEARIALAAIYDERGEPARAEAELREVIAASPEHPVARFMLARIQSRRAGAPAPPTARPRGE